MLVEKSVKICEGRQYLLAEMIGVSETGLVRSLKAGKLSPRLRARVVALVVAGRLPDALPPARAPGRQPGISPMAGSVNVHFASETVKNEFLRMAGEGADEAALVRVGDETATSRFRVLIDAICAYRAKHRHPPERLDAPPPWKLRCKIAKGDTALHLELLGFDDWIGGAEHRPLVFSTVLEEHCRHVEVIRVKGRPAGPRRSGSPIA